MSSDTLPAVLQLALASTPHTNNCRPRVQEHTLRDDIRVLLLDLLRDRKPRYAVNQVRRLDEEPRAVDDIRRENSVDTLADGPLEWRSDRAAHDTSFQLVR